jgi:hypothetical protein
MGLDEDPTSADLAGDTVEVFVVRCQQPNLRRETTAGVISDCAMGLGLIDIALNEIYNGIP